MDITSQKRQKDCSGSGFHQDLVKGYVFKPLRKEISSDRTVQVEIYGANSGQTTIENPEAALVGSRNITAKS